MLSVSRVHWIYPLQGLFWFAVMAGLGFYIEHMLHSHAGIHAPGFRLELGWLRFDEKNTPIPWMFSIAGFMVFWLLFLKYISNEVGLTDQRIIHKKGLIFVEILQLDLEDIRGENVIHGWLGWLLGYGRIHLDCRFIEDVELPAISNPYRLVKASHTARMRHPVIDYTAQELEINLDEIEKRKKQAAVKIKLRALGNKIKQSFRQAS